MRKLLYILGGGKTLRRCAQASYTLNNLPLILTIAFTLALSLSGCGTEEYGNGDEGDYTRSSVNQSDSTSTSDADSCSLDVYIQGVEWEDSVNIKYIK